MFYTIYKITNKIDGKFYIGKHQTTDLNDGYMGSGKLIKRAIGKHGIENFTKEILHVFDNEAAMNEAESKLVVLTEESYNLCPGGHGGFGYVNAHGLNNAGKDFAAIGQKLSEKLSGRKNPAAANRLVERHKRGLVNYNNFLGQSHSEETKKLISENNKVTSKGERNSQFGKMWITDGNVTLKVPKGIDLPTGFKPGRTF